VIRTFRFGKTLPNETTWDHAHTHANTHSHPFLSKLMHKVHHHHLTTKSITVMVSFRKLINVIHHRKTMALLLINTIESSCG